MAYIIAIDGPAGSGKGTAAKMIAQKLNYIYIDTGAMYRAVALKCLRSGIDETNETRLLDLLVKIDIRFKSSNGIFEVFLDDEDVTKEIRTMEVDELVPRIAANSHVRDRVTVIQRHINKDTDIVIEGRDICTKIFPNAQVKIFLDASLEIRAQRRYDQNIKMGIECNYDEIFENIKERSRLDQTREHSPLIMADDATYIDSSDKTIDEVVNIITKLIEAKINQQNEYEF